MELVWSLLVEICCFRQPLLRRLGSADRALTCLPAHGDEESGHVNDPLSRGGQVHAENPPVDEVADVRFEVRLFED